MAVSGTITVDFNLTDRRTVGLATNITVNPRILQTITYADGVGQNQGNKVYGVQRTLAGATDSVDLAGVLLDAFGGTITDLRIKGIVIYNPAGNAPLVVGAGSNPITTIFSAAGTITVKPDGIFLLATADATGYAVVAGTADILQTAGTTGQSYILGFLGADA